MRRKIFSFFLFSFCLINLNGDEFDYIMRLKAIEKATYPVGTTTCLAPF